MSYFIYLTSLHQWVCTCYCLIPHPDKGTPTRNDITLAWVFFYFSPVLLRGATPRRSSLLSSQGNNDDPLSKKNIGNLQTPKSGDGVYHPLSNKTVSIQKTRRVYILGRFGFGLSVAWLAAPVVVAAMGGGMRTEGLV